MVLLPWLSESSGAPDVSPPASSVASLVVAINDLERRGEISSRRRSSNHAAIRLIQEGLACVGMAVVADGFFGAKSEAAIRSFQTWAGIGADGVVGPKTLAALAHALDTGAHIDR